MYGGLIASGGFTVTLWYRSCIPITDKVALLSGFEWHIKLLLPVRPNDRLRARISVLSKRPSSKPGRGYALVLEEVFNQDETLVFSCEGTWMLASRS
jgi:acyl dehydratase